MTDQKIKIKIDPEFVNKLKIYFACAFSITFVLYLLASLIALSLNPTNWWILGRIIYSILIITNFVISWGLAEDIDDNYFDYEH
jgi:ABC-type sugar transport system permease subunit